VARDRIVGIAFGLLVFGILERLLWPVRADERRQQRFADVLRSLAALVRLGARSRTDTGPDRELDDLRRRVAQGLSVTQRLLEESKFELDAGDLDVFQQRIGDAHTIFLVLLSVAYQRRRTDGALLRSLPEPADQLGEAVAMRLEALADSTPDGRMRPIPDLDASLAAVKRALDSVPHLVPEDEATIAVRRWLELHQTLVGLVSPLEPWRASPPRLQMASRF
jgi:plasmid stabilization system protein ParE